MTRARGGERGSRFGEHRAELVAMVPAAVRRRVLRRWLLDGGAVGLTDAQIRSVDALVTAWRGQGAVAVPSALARRRLFAGRRGAVLTLYREPVAD